ncbi:MAG: hypothetical protein IT305_15470 [Chloroflexi bacterium]|nr:hypothetical protein [Chloroflexota bacterium]
MEPDQVAAQVRERSGLEVQAVTLVRGRAGAHAEPRVWTAMTEHAHFWVVEDGFTVELFRAVAQRVAASNLSACHSAVEAVRRFLALHPQKGTLADEVAGGSDRTPSVSGDGPEDGPAMTGFGLTCDVCGTGFTRRRQSSQSTRPICPRCRHAERERLRYHQDPQYRARRLAYSATRYRQHHGTAAE